MRVSIVLLSSLVACTLAATRERQRDEKVERVERFDENETWWKRTIFYQLLVESFKDSNGDGVGDIAGITQNIGHLNSLVVGAMVLSPIYKQSENCKAPGILDYKSITAEFGNLGEFQELIREAQRSSIKVLLSLPLYGMSTDSLWFRLSANRTAGFENFFIWNNRKPELLRYKDEEADNWKWSHIRNQFYKMGENGAVLNLENYRLIDEIKQAMQYWLDFGIHGFKIDLDGADDKLFVEAVTDLKNVLNQYSRGRDGESRILIVHSLSSNEKSMMYYDENGMGAANLVYNDNFYTELDKASTAKDVKFLIDKWLTYLPENSIATWATGDPDNTRLATLLGNVKIDAINALVLLLPGVAFINQGDEIGMEDYDAGAESSECDVSLESMTPYHWDDTVSAGFSRSSRTWIPVDPNFRFNNVQSQRSSKKSHLRFYHAVAQARKAMTLREGDVNMKIFRNVLVVMRKLKGKESFVGVFNFGRNSENLDLTEMDLGEMMTYFSSEKSVYDMGDKVTADRVRIGGGESIVFMAAPQQCPNEKPVDRIMSRLSDFMTRINGFLGLN